MSVNYKRVNTCMSIIEGVNICPSIIEGLTHMLTAWQLVSVLLLPAPFVGEWHIGHFLALDYLRRLLGR